MEVFIQWFAWDAAYVSDSDGPERHRTKTCFDVDPLKGIRGSKAESKHF